MPPLPGELSIGEEVGGGGDGGGGDGVKMGQDLIPVEVRIGRVCRFCLLHG